MKENTIKSPVPLGYDAIIVRLTTILESLGPFADDAKRSSKWRTADQLATELHEQGIDVDSSRIEELLKSVHRTDLDRVAKGKVPQSPVRRAMRPDLTTTKLLWGSTKHLGYVWKDF